VVALVRKQNKQQQKQTEITVKNMGRFKGGSKLTNRDDETRIPVAKCDQNLALTTTF